MPALSPLRARLASFEHAYAIACQQQQLTSRRQFVVRTRNPLQPFKVTGRPPEKDEELLTLFA